ncbi:hypothetical protein AAG570_011520 [Ranatra chinensis]|uniref:Uncharacterized protein n=1 Tax=Ranatra chinensis TaxID=642074 RepID=A0ABD0Z976_9HEMI
MMRLPAFYGDDKESADQELDDYVSTDPSELQSFLSCLLQLGGPDDVVVSMYDYHAKRLGFDSPRGQSWLKARLTSRPLGLYLSVDRTSNSAKRKQLPAWIREGLEKMEREKQKKAESERLERQRQEELARQHQDQEPPDQEIVEANGSPALPKKSKFETDSDESDDEKEVADEKIIDKIRKSRFDRRLPEQPSFVKPVFHSKEEILQYVMREVRKTLTQLLMEVTTEEMRAAAEEVHNQFQRKGLGIYDSDSGSENSETEGAVNGADSDQELRERIMRRKEDFLDTEEQINKEVAESEEKERRVLSGKKSASREVSPEMEEQVQPTQQVQNTVGVLVHIESGSTINTKGTDGVGAAELKQGAEAEIKAEAGVEAGVEIEVGKGNIEGRTEDIVHAAVVRGEDRQTGDQDIAAVQVVQEEFTVKSQVIEGEHW